MKLIFGNLKRVVIMPALRRIKKWVDQLYFQFRKNRATPVLILQMGKVGSTSIYWSLLRQHPGAVLHAHSFTPDHHDPTLRRLYYRTMVNKKPLNVISLTREPIGRNISAFFQNFERRTGIPYSKSNLTTEELKDIFIEKHPHEFPLQWFDKYMHTGIYIDVYATPFPESGIATYTHNNVRLLVMRLEVPDHIKAAAINDFLGLDHFQLNRYNVGQKKDYSAAYSSLKSSLELPNEFIEKMCGSKYFTHFYGENMMNKMREKWGGKEKTPS